MGAERIKAVFDQNASVEETHITCDTSERENRGLENHKLLLLTSDAIFNIVTIREDINIGKPLTYA